MRIEADGSDPPPPFSGESPHARQISAILTRTEYLLNHTVTK